jgi:hypothetical protein
MLEPTWAMARPGSGQPFVICAGPAQERFSFIGKMKTFVLLARPEFLLSSATERRYTCKWTDQLASWIDDGSILFR